MKHNLLTNSNFMKNELVSVPTNKAQVFIKDVFGKMHLVYVDKSEKISIVKKRLINKSILESTCNLYLNGNLLSDDETLENNEIENQFIISVIGVLKGGMKIYVKNIEGKVLTFEIGPNDTVLDLKNKIQEKTGHPPKRQKLVFQGSVLHDQDTLKNANIDVESTVNMVLTPCDEITVTILLGNDKRIDLQLSKNDEIREIKAKLQREIDLNTKDQVLLFDSTILEDHKKINNYNIQDKDTINLVINSSTNKMFYIFIVFVVALVAFEFLRFLNK